MKKDEKLEHVYGEDVRKRATSSQSLSTRIDINRKYQSKNFGSWLFKRLQVQPGENILDVGCGTGSQSLRFLEEIGKNGRVDALDLSEDSVNELLVSSHYDKRLNAVVADMAELDKIIKNTFQNSKYTLAHSSYALYYSPFRISVLRSMVEAIYNFGRVAVFTPVVPHGMVDLAVKIGGGVPDAVWESLKFGPEVLEQEFRKIFLEIEIHYFQSLMKVSNIDDFISFYKATTYFNEIHLDEMERYARKEIAENGAVCYEKNGYLIIGRDAK